MEFLSVFWLPTLLSAVFVFVVSSVIHMALPIHKGDYKKLPNEDKLLDAMRTQSVAPGHYMFPYAGSMKEMGNPEMVAKMKSGPVGFATIMPSGGCNIGKSLIQWFLFSLFIGVLIAYVADLTLPTGTNLGLVFRITSVLGTMCYAVGCVPDSIWKGMSWSVTLKFVFDGLLYGLATGAAFTWFWPKG